MLCIMFSLLFFAFDCLSASFYLFLSLFLRYSPHVLAMPFHHRIRFGHTAQRIYQIHYRVGSYAYVLVESVPELLQLSRALLCIHALFLAHFLFFVNYSNISVSLLSLSKVQYDAYRIKLCIFSPLAKTL